MLINLNKNRNLQLDIDEIENDENKEYYLLVKVQPQGREEKVDGEVVQKVAIDDASARLIPNKLVDLILNIISEYYQKINENSNSATGLTHSEPRHEEPKASPEAD